MRLTRSRQRSSGHSAVAPGALEGHVGGKAFDQMAVELKA